MTQNIHHNQDVFNHILDVMKNTKPELVQRLMALFHDIGKTVTKTVDDETGAVHFYGHELEGEKIVEDIMTRLKYPRDLIDAVKVGVRNHMRLKQSGEKGEKIKPNTLLNFRNQMGDQLENVLGVMDADNRAHSEASSLPLQIAGIRQRLLTLKEIPKKAKLPISGRDLMAIGIKQGPLIGKIVDILNKVWTKRAADGLPFTKEDALKIARKIAKI